MLRPPQPAVYLILLDVSHSAVETGYLEIVCQSLIENLDKLPGDKRTMVGFLSYNRTIQFYKISEEQSQPQMIIVSDVEDAFIPTSENLLVNLHECKEQIVEFLNDLPSVHQTPESPYDDADTYSSLGAAMKIAVEMMKKTGGRISVFQQSMPSIGPGKLQPREDPNKRAAQEISSILLRASTDFYTQVALESQSSQVAIDMFFLSSRYIDIATLANASRHSAGEIRYYKGLHIKHNPQEAERFQQDLDRYFTRKIGFESVMRIRCSSGLTFNTFYGNKYSRAPDLLALANINPDAGYAVQMQIDETLEVNSVCFQAALLYTSSKGERRIRIHTLCFPVVKDPIEVIKNADAVACISLLSKMAVDRAMTQSLSDAKDSIMNALVDLLKCYKHHLKQKGIPVNNQGVYVPENLKLFPMYLHSLLKHKSLRGGIATELDDRVFSMLQILTQPIKYMLSNIHPDMYRVDNIQTEEKEDGTCVVPPDLLPPSSEKISLRGAYLLDCGWEMYMLVGKQCDHQFIQDVLDKQQFSDIPEPMWEVPDMDNDMANNFKVFLRNLRDSRPHHAPLRIIREDQAERQLFISKLLHDRTQSSTSLTEFLISVAQKIAI